MRSPRIHHVIAAAMGSLMITSHADIAADWGVIAGRAIRADNATNPLGRGPTYASRTTAMVDVAMFDAANAVQNTYSSYAYSGATNPAASPEAAAAKAARDVLASLYPTQTALFDTQLSTHLSTITDATARNAGLSLGSAAAQSIITARATDGAHTGLTYTFNPDPGHYRPTGVNTYPSNPTIPVGIGWGEVTPWVLTSASQFTTPGPPALNSPQYTAAYNEVKAYGALNSSVRTADQTEIGIFWAYDRGSLGPPTILYNNIVSVLSETANLNLVDSTRLHALSSIAQADAIIASWKVKYETDFWRPIDGIREGDFDTNPDTVGDPAWQPLGAPGSNPASTADDFTPPFPGYVSGHSAFGGALFEVARDFFDGSTFEFTLASGELPGVTRTYTDFDTPEAENAVSRVYLGVHWSFDDDDGITLGNEIGDYTFKTIMQPRPVPEPSTGLAAVIGAAFLSLRRRRPHAA
jgi:hypothetical protein